MSTEELKNIIKERFDAEFVCNFKHLGKEYIRAVKISNNSIFYLYLQQDGNVISEIKDKNLLEYFKNYYSSKNSNIVY